jgi:hypothetical protein
MSVQSVPLGRIFFEPDAHFWLLLPEVGISLEPCNKVPDDQHQKELKLNL